jgi:predicted enzyme related to lactoylglutathione lyase
MEQRLTFLTLGVRDFALMKEWYTHAFGWTPFKDEDDICFFQLNGIVFALYPADALAEDIGILNDGVGFKRFTCSINFDSEEEVNQATNALRDKGARIVRLPEKVFWGGYRGYIADPEDNYWELAYNPFLPSSPAL